MSKVFDEFMRKCSCRMRYCPFGHEIRCKDCVEKMVSEHDAEVRKDFLMWLQNEGYIHTHPHWDLEKNAEEILQEYGAISDGGWEE